jgi:type IV secretory pathway VirB4 component
VPAVLEWIKELSKRVRKYSGSLVVVTQNVSDFTSDEVRRAGEAILANSSTRLLLRQEGNDLDACRELFGLTDEERSRVALAEQGHGLLLAGNARVWLEVVAAPHEEELATLK